MTQSGKDDGPAQPATPGVGVRTPVPGASVAELLEGVAREILSVLP